MTDSVMGSWSYTYDDFNRLTGATATAGVDNGLSLNWTYDRYGNRWGQNATGTGNASAVQPQLTFYGTNGVVNHHVDGWSYDAAGNTLNDNRNAYAYDAQGRIVSLNGQPMYVYDAEGRRVATLGSGGTVATSYLLDLSGNQITELNGSGQWVHSNVFAGGRLLATFEGPAGPAPNSYHFHLTDWLGTNRMQTNSAGSQEEICYSYPFGDGLLCNGTASDATEHHFTGKERDTESGNDYFEARYLASSMGRFLSPDPSNLSVDWWLPQTWNRYTYGLNNPLTMVDKNGLWPSPVHFLINESSFPGMSKQDMQRLKDATWNMDWAPGQQDPRNSFQHGMSNGSDDVGGSPGLLQEEARQDADTFISQQVAAAQQAQADWEAQGHTGIAPAALTAFGNALHTVQDRTSPSHQGEQPWSGKAKDVPGHLWREKWPSNNQWTAAKNASRDLFHRTFGNEFDWVFFKNPCARTEASDSQGNSTGWSGCQ